VTPTTKPVTEHVDGEVEGHAVRVHLDQLLADRGMTLTELSERVGVSVVNLSILKNGRAKAVRFTTLTRLCAALDCQPGDLLSYQPTPAAADRHPATDH
jgi:putative transcriptional regulator